MQEIKVTKTTNSQLSNLDFDNIPFGKVFTDHMFVVDYENGQWVNPRIEPVAPIPTHPGNLAWHYGQSIFEGMKATVGKTGNPLLFRPEEHVIRLNASARRMCMPELPHDMFLDALKKLVYLEKEWIPSSEGSALYVRPFMFATDEAIGVRPSDSYKFIIVTLPVGPYYPKPVKLKAAEFYVRAAVGGVGEAKTAGNYAASLYPAKLAKEEGYDQMMWLDAKEFKYIQEVGTMNIFFVMDGKVVTPSINGAILKGITRKTILEILKSKGYTCEERNVTIDEVFEAYEAGKLSEVFGTGTAAVVATVSEIKHKDRILKLDPDSFVVSKLAKSTINGLRNESIEDSFGWVEEVDAKAAGLAELV